MKNLVLLFIIPIALTACTKKVHNKKMVKSTPSLNNITLDGLSGSDAEKMVSNFVQNNESSDSTTNIFLSKGWVDNVAAILADEYSKDNSVDGFRIYFAKDNGNNTVVIVSTKRDGPDTLASPMKSHYHKDYFDHSSSTLSKYLTTITDTTKQEDYSQNEGATLYFDPKCPTKTCEISDVNNGISCPAAQVAVRNFEQAPINIESEWFPLELLLYLKNELDAAKLKIPADGIRIYFAKYPIDTTYGRRQNRHGFIIVTTKSVGPDHQDYYECYASQPDSLMHKINNLKGSNDNGEQCPNNCDDVTMP